MGLRQTTKISIVDQIVNQIKIQIDTGELKTGDKLPSQVEMEKIFASVAQRSRRQFQS